MASFRFNDAFETRLEELAEKLGKTKTAVIIDSVNAYASGTIPDSGIIELLNQLAANDGQLFKSLDELKTLVLQVLKNQQSP